MALILGPSNRGKTFLSFEVAGHFIEDVSDDWLVNYALALELRYDQDIKDVESRMNDKRWKSLYIIDDCHDQPNHADRFLQWAFHNRHSTCHFLFIMRGFSTDELDSPFSLLKKENCVFSFIPNIEYRKKIIRSYIRSIELKHAESPNLNPSDEKLEQLLYQKIGTNLDLLIRLLKDTWDPDNQDIIKVDQAKILSIIWKQYGLDRLERRRLISVISALGQFDIGTSVSFLELNSAGDLIPELINKKILKINISLDSARFVKLCDTKDAEYLLKAIAVDERVEPYKYTIEILRKYLKYRPPNTLMVFYMLWRNKEKEIIKAVFQDTDSMIALQESLIGRSLTSIDYISLRLEIIDPTLTYRLFSHDGLMQEFRGKVKGASGYHIRHALAVLHHEEIKRKFFESWSEQDYLMTIEATNRINTLRYLFYDLNKGRLPDIAEKFADQLPKADLKKLLVFNNQESLIDLNHLIGNIRFIPAKLGPFLQKLAVVVPDAFVERSKVEEVRWFLWQMLSFEYESTSKFVEGHVKVLAELIASSQITQAFFVLWNAFQANKECAYQIAKSKEVTFQQKIPDPNQDLIIGIAWLALLNLCGIQMSKPKITPADLKQILDELAKQRDPCLQIICLKGLSILLSNVDLEEVKTTIDLNMLSKEVEDFPIPQTRGFLLGLINEFRIAQIS